MKFEWDDNKSLVNKAKHGIDFNLAKEMWTDSKRVEIQAPYPLEKRRIIIARLATNSGQQYSHIVVILFVLSQ